MKNSIRAIAALTLDSAAFAGAYKSFSAAGLPAPCSIIRIVNASTVPVSISYDGGTNTHEYLLAGSDLVLNLQASSQPNNYSAVMSKGTPVSVKGAVGVGLVYLIGYYQAR